MGLSRHLLQIHISGQLHVLSVDTKDLKTTCVCVCVGGYSSMNYYQSHTVYLIQCVVTTDKTGSVTMGIHVKTTKYMTVITTLIENKES